MFDGTKYLLQCVWGSTLLLEGTSHLMPKVYEKPAVDETQFEGWVYVTFISIFGFNYNLSLISENSTIYNKLEIQKMNSICCRCQAIFQILSPE